MESANGSSETRVQAARRRLRHGRNGRSMLSATVHHRQPSRMTEFARIAFTAFDELQTLWPTRLAGVRLDIVMAPEPKDRVVGREENGRQYSVDWRSTPETQNITIFRARIENTVRIRMNKEPYLLQLQVEEAVCRAVAEYLGVAIIELLHGER